MTSRHNQVVFKQFTKFSVVRQDVALNCLVGGNGPPLLLLHGHPQTHVMWHLVAPQLASRFTVVMMDLRGYGDSGRPQSTQNQATYSKREMALDAVAVMKHLGIAKFDILAHDRGARVAHRLALDNPNTVGRLLLLDIAPTLAMYSNTSEAFARAYWHWFFLIQPPPLPEALIDSDPVRYLRSVMGNRFAGLSAFAPHALAEYERCIQIPGTAHSICEDYRSSAFFDMALDTDDQLNGNQIHQPLKIIWGQKGAVGQCFDVLSLWKKCASNVTGLSFPCGHYIAEEAASKLLEETFNFFKIYKGKNK